jgi:hypothetical protein
LEDVASNDGRNAWSQGWKRAEELNLYREKAKEWNLFVRNLISSVVKKCYDVDSIKSTKNQGF